MSEENKSCSGNCGSCSASCEKRDLMAPANEHSRVKKVIGVVSGKGGVGKSTVTSLLACAVRKTGREVAVFDGDITGPSIPMAFGIHSKAVADDRGLLPAVSKNGIKVMSVNLLLPEEDRPVVWRGPVISGVIKQFWSDVVWGDVDYMFVDMPPGTGDVPLTVFQSLPVDGIVVVTTPQDLVTMIVKKAYNMAQMMNVPVLGIVENMSGFVCPDCGKSHEIFGESKAEKVAEALGVPVLAKLPLNPQNAALVDKGEVELADSPEINEAAEKVIAKLS